LMQFALRAAGVSGGVLRAGHAALGALIEMGFGMPARLPEAAWYIARTQPFFATTQGVDNAVRLAVEPMSLTVHNQEIVSGTSFDNLSLESILSRPSLGGTFTWAMSHTAHTKIATIPVHPCVGGAFGTPLSWASTFFNMWTGSLKVKLYFSVPSTVRGSLIVLYTPNTSTTPAYSQVSQCQPIVIDVAGSTSVEIDVGWAQDVVALKVNNTAFPTLTSSIGGSFVCNGVLSVFVQQPLIASGATAFQTAVVVTYSAGEDFAFLDPNIDFANNLTLNSAAFSTPLFQVATRHFEHRIEGARRVPEQIASISGGAIIKSLRELIKRRTPHFMHFPTSNGEFGAAVDMPWFVAGFPTQQDTGNEPDFQILPCFLSNAAVPFAGFSGSVRHTLSWFQNSEATPTNTGSSLFFVSRRPAGNNNGIVTYSYNQTQGTQAFAFAQLGNGADAAHAPNGQSPQFLSVEVPFIAQRYALPVPLEADDGDSAIRVTILWSAQHPENLALIDYVSAGDDFDVFEWIGVPPMTYSFAPNEFWVVDT